MHIFEILFFIVFAILEVWIAVYLLLPSFLLLVYRIKKWTGTQFSVNSRKPVIQKDFDFACVITAHKDVRFIHPLVDSLCRQNYSNFHIYVVADACEVSGLQFNDSRITLLKPEQDLNSKIRSIDLALKNYIRDHDALIIFDADNLVHPSYLQILNKYFQLGYRAVQTNMQPKNTDTLYAKLDTIGDIYYNFTEREMRMELGLSPAIWGLGIAIETKLYREIVYQDHLGGFDKRLQADLVRKIPPFAFAKEAIVYDEKISDGQSLQVQRTRWLNAQFKYFKLAFTVLSDGIKNRNFNVIYFGFINLRPPLFMVLGLAFLFTIINYPINPLYSWVWLSILFVFLASFFLIIATKANDRKVFNAIFYMPLFVMRQVFALLKIRRANKSFMKTEHTKIIFIEDLLKNEPA